MVPHGNSAGRVLASAAVYVSPDDARSDVILAAAATIFGGFAVRLVTQLPLYPQRGWTPVFLSAAWVFAITGLVPLLLARYRGDGLAAFGLTTDRSGWTAGLALVVPVVAVGVVVSLLRPVDPVRGLLGPFGGLAALGVVAGVLQFAAMAAGALLLVAFLSVRGREAFRPIDVPLTQFVRTVGMGAAGVALVLGLARALGAPRVLPAVVNAVGLAVLVLLADRLVPARAAVPRGAFLTPIVVVVVAHVFATGGFIFGDLVTGLYSGALGAGGAIAIAALVNLGNRAWATVPLVAALHWWPTCLSPLALGTGMC